VRVPVMLIVGACLCSAVVLCTPNANAHGCASAIPPAVTDSPIPAPARKGTVLLNEVLLDPQSTWNCSQSGTDFINEDSWVELYNPQSQPFNLYAVHAYLDSGPNTTIYYLPFGAAIAAHGFLVVFPRTVGNFAPTETPTLRLLIAGVTIDQVEVPKLAGDQSYARIADGGSKWHVTNTPTIDASNDSAGASSSPTLTSTSTGSRSNTSTSSGNDSPFIDGTQPAWSKLSVPATLSSVNPPLASRPPPILLPAPSPTSGGLDLPWRVELTVVTVFLALALLWCWQLFRAP
jgi:hypothetical protein